MQKRNTNKRSRKSILIIMLIAIGAVIVVVATLTTLNFLAANSQRQVVATHDETLAMKQIVANIRDTLSDSRVSWEDKNKCTVIDPRLFGDKTAYYCTAQYQRDIPVSSQDDIDGEISKHVHKLATVASVHEVSKTKIPLYIADKSAIEESEQAQLGEIIFKISATDLATCWLSYMVTWTNEQPTLREVVNCNVNTGGAYYEPISHG